jgi:Cu2+-containing amine oxidase
MATSGSIVWPSASEPLWQFDWWLADSPDEEGLVISQARYRGHQVFYKASLPSLRVQYYGGGWGPYKDPLNYNNAKPTSWCPTSQTTRVCTYSYVDSNGFRALVVQSYHEIGSYRITHRWIFWEDGKVYPRLYSAGLQHPYNHSHHTYWRFDFDIDNSSSDLVLEYNAGSPNIGWGAGWTPLTSEQSRIKNPATNRTWAVLDTSSNRGYHIRPGPNDGVANAFSNRDLWVLRYRGSEDLHGNQGSAYSDALAPYVNGEDVNGQDVVVWYVGHLFHLYDPNDPTHNDWHDVGPDLNPFGNWT